MEKNKANEKKNIRKIPFFKKTKFKFNTVSTVIIVVFMICLIAVNILASFLSERFSAFSIDLTGEKYSISDSNVEYIKKIEKEISIIIPATESEYVSNTAEYAYQFGYSCDEGYLNQTVELLKNYPKINDKISLVFIDSSTPAFNQYKERYNAEIASSSVIIDRTYTDKNGEEKTKYKILEFEDLYNVETDSSNYSYSVTSSNVETAVTSALYYVASDRTDKITVITGYGCEDMSAYLADLEISGYLYEEIEDLSVYDIPEDTTILMIAAPTIDLSQSDTKKIREFLLGNSENADEFDYGKSLVYFASSKQNDLSNLDALLKEWGIGFESGTVYETSADNYITSNAGGNTAPVIYDAGSDYSIDLSSNYRYYTYNSRPMFAEFNSKGKYNVYDILTTSSTCVKMPYSVSDSWEPSNEKQRTFSSMLLSRFVTEDPKTEDDVRFSNVLAVSAVDFITTFKDIAYVGNDELLLSLINVCAGRDTETYEIENKKIDYSTFQATEIQAKAVNIVIHYIVPVLVVIIGIIIYVIRKIR